jgi:hypothetical protein
MYSQQRVKEKDVFIVDSHHQVLMPWSLIRRQCSEAPNLITLDHHTDTHKPFRNYVCSTCNSNETCQQDLRERLLSTLDWKNNVSIEDAIKLLKHDEHIQTATATGIINIAFAINLSGSTTSSIEEEKYQTQTKGLFPWEKQKVRQPTEPYTYELPSNRIFEIDASFHEEYQKNVTEQDYQEWRSEKVLESAYLDKQMAVAKQMSIGAHVDSVEETEYILDIDLDYFHSEKSISPDDTRTIYRLIRNAKAITIARESQCVEDLKIEDSSITSESLLDSMLKHIRQAQE